MPRQTLKRRPDGRYVCKYHGVSFYGQTQTEALAAREAYKRDEERGIRQDAQLTVGEYASRWLPVHKADVGPKTFADYSKQVSKLISQLGDKLLIEVVPSDIKAVYNQYIGLSESTIKRARFLFTAIFSTAVEDGYLVRNPCTSESARPHRGTSGSHRAITAEEAQLIRITPHRVRLAAMVMLYAGLRRGEAMAVDLDADVDWKRKVLCVSKAVRYESNQPIVDTPKTEAGVREVPLAPILQHELKGKHGLLLPSAQGVLCSDTAFRRAWDSYMHALSMAAGQPVSIRPHDLRHSYCTMLRDAGVDLKIAMLWMGHSDKDMILKIYDHITPARITHSAAAFARFTARESQNGSQTNAG